MAYNEFLADRIRRVFNDKKVVYTEKKMFGGMCFMVDDKMCVGPHEDRLMVRIDPEIYEEQLQRPGASKMMFTGREMKGFIFVDEDGMDTDADLEHWIDLALEFNPKAKSSKKKKTPRK